MTWHGSNSRCQIEGVVNQMASIYFGYCCQITRQLVTDSCPHIIVIVHSVEDLLPYVKL